MKVNKLHLQDFGQFHEKDVILAPGVNVVYGANEAGKSTTKDFIVDMLYGIDKSRGVGARFDHYEQKKPINGAAFSGAMEVSVDGKSYLIERNFSRQDKKTTVRDLDTGREVPLQEAHNLMGTLLHTDKTTYMNTLCIGQIDTSTDKEIADKLNNYIVNMASTKAGDIDAVNAIMELKNKKKEFSNKELEQQAQELTAQIVLERDYDAELVEIKNEYAEIEAAMNGKKSEEILFTPIKNSAVEEVVAQEQQENTETYSEDEEHNTENEEEIILTKRERDIQMLQNMGKKSILDNVFVIMCIGLLIIALFVGIAYVLPIGSSEVKLGIIGVGTLLVLITLVQVFVRRANLYQLMEEMEIEQGFEEAKSGSDNAETTESVKAEAGAIDPEVQKQMVNQLSDLKVKEQNILRERNEQEQVLLEVTRIKEQIKANNVEIEALDLAIKTIQDLSEEIYDSFGSVLNEQVSEIVRRITNHKYSEVKIDDQLRVMVKKGNSFITIEYLSTGTISQIYFALRLAIANVLIDEELPIIIDDVFATYDYQRIYDTIGCLSEYLNRQIIIFTTNPGIQDMFVNLGIQSNYISL